MTDASNPMLKEVSAEKIYIKDTRKWTQYAATMAASLGSVCAGTALAWTSPVLPQLENNPDATLPLTTSQGSWVGSLLAIGALISAIPAGICAEKFGRKLTVLSLSLPFLISWLLIVQASCVDIIYIARLLAGVATGSICVTVPMYIGETAEASIRGSLGSFFQMFLCVGILVSFAVGAFVDYVKLSTILAVLPVLFALCFYFMPESPVYLLKRGRQAEAEKSLYFLRGPNYNVQPELEEIQAAIDASAGKKASIKDLVSNKSNASALMASLGLMFCQQFSGINAVIFYTVPIFQSAGSTLDPSMAAILVAVVQVVLAYVTVLVIEKTGRKVFLMQSTVIMGACLFALAYYFQLKDGGKDVSNIGTLPLGSLILFIISFCLGLGPIPWMLNSELFASDVRGLATGISVMTNWFLVFIVTKCFSNMLASMGSAGTFGTFGIIMVIGTYFIYKYVPETKGKTLQEIQNVLAGGSNQSV